jgi:hypothetical protein
LRLISNAVESHWTISRTSILNEFNVHFNRAIATELIQIFDQAIEAVTYDLSLRKDIKNAPLNNPAYQILRDFRSQNESVLLDMIQAPLNLRNGAKLLGLQQRIILKFSEKPPSDKSSKEAKVEKKRS